MTSATCRRSDRAAFTLLELLLVLGILATLVSLSLPHVGRSFRHLGVRDAAATLAETVRFAQAAAVTESAAMRVVFDETERRYRVERAAEPASGRFEPAATPSGGTVSLPEEVFFERVQLVAEDGMTPVDCLSFFPDGSGASGEISLRFGEEAWRVVVSRRFGVVRAESVRPEAGQ